ncbi:AAA family ATPase [Dyadobacter fanqingshengii]|uniref:AAA family ATPase n=1 Tax=Dyadobacter fanqingshengii TaxID=2906443 RepID=A0A9X1T727_9BACT|nr:AAA family ATPase [Dyadobacter fanqingshengii]MCF0038690.1 AAA family ATPase [Dyadobacter fanqingshengii]USJ34477.1 AAA family ATPase [Dyadobacter fanqingshengii]
MAENTSTKSPNGQADTLESAIKKFANELPYWSKFLAERRLSGWGISDEEIDTAYVCLMEQLGLLEKTERPEITVNYNPDSARRHKGDLVFAKLENVEGVNALVEGQKLEFGPNLTIIFGSNGSGKTGYTRLLKQVFHSKSREEILPNVHIAAGHKPVGANFLFVSGTTKISLTLKDRARAEFEQFSVFDGKSVICHLDQKNEFEFRPAGLSFFGEMSAAIGQVEKKLETELTFLKNSSTPQDLSALFDGESEIKTAVIEINANTKKEALNKYTPFSDEDKQQQSQKNKNHDDLLVASKNTEKEIKHLENLKKLITDNKTSIDTLNRFFSTNALEKINKTIEDYLEKEAIAKAEGSQKFQSETILDIGTDEWKQFILSAEKFAKTQKSGDTNYPEDGDYCILCQQLLTREAQSLIDDYWAFIKSLAEENARGALNVLEKIVITFEELKFDLLPEDNVLVVWMNDNYPARLKEIKHGLKEQHTLRNKILTSLREKKPFASEQFQTTLRHHQDIESEIESKIKIVKNNDLLRELEKLKKEKTFLDHKEKFNSNISKFESCLIDQQWIHMAGKANFKKAKTDVTNAEKSLSDKYFNQKYIDEFNKECHNLNGNFGIEIAHTGSAGKSYRQLKLKGKNPHAVLSEGEQKVIAIADYLVETRLSEANRGLIFDDPVNSLDEKRKSEIARRIVVESSSKQTIIFTHDLIFLSSLIGHCGDLNVEHSCHWIENRGGNPGQVWLNNSPSYEREYRNAELARNLYTEAAKFDCSPSNREYLIRSGFACLRTSYEVLVIHELFGSVVQRFNERVSIDALSKVHFDRQLIDQLQDSFAQCCRHMEGHTHSDKYAYKKPEPNDLNSEIKRFDDIKAKIRKVAKQ